MEIAFIEVLVWAHCNQLVQDVLFIELALKIYTFHYTAGNYISFPMCVLVSHALIMSFLYGLNNIES